ncbi:hypothetical protein [Pedobacter flavus]|uniref:Lipopolysaccharide biosynthesis protein n=1 Tax=Pedobacter flavus TaxID=3113906 RepID=A0ABU7H0C2_9SPHI|nr:hypothetical protein [Pedobacter sp. VNH31]MEE1884691.1 hypothetical protein [Pedobacter sp. VNH31]
MQANPINNNEDVVSLREIIITVQKLFLKILSKWYIIIGVAILGAGYGYYKSRKDKTYYTAVTTFLLEEGAPPPVPSGLAALLGGANSGGGGLFQGNTLLTLYKSRLMLEKTLFSKVIINGKEVTLLDKYLELNKIEKSWSQHTKEEQGAVIKGVISDLATNYITITPGDIMVVEIKSTDEDYSLALGEKLIETVNDYYIATKTKKTVDNLKILEKQADSLRSILTRSMSQVAAQNDAVIDANPAKQILRVPGQRQAIDVQTNTSLYATVMATLENTKLELRKEKPLIQILEKPYLPLNKEEPNKLKTILLYGIFGAIFSVVGLIISLLYKKIMKDDKA